MMRQHDQATGMLGLAALAGAISAATAGCASPARRIPVHPAPGPIIRQVADRVLQDSPQPPRFNWGEGVLMAGMMRSGQVLNEPRYTAFVQRWADHWRNQGLDAILAGAPTDAIRGYCGHWGPGLPVIMLYEETRDPAYLAMCRQIADFIMTKATRTGDGGLSHWGGNHQLWVDTLYMVCPLFSHLTPLTHDPAFLREAARQLEICANHNQDPRTGLFWHMYDEPSGQCAGVLWGRGNGWVTMSYVDVLRNLDRGSAEFSRLHGQFRRQMDGLMAFQDSRAHLWHTVLDRPETYLETSASAMILESMVQAGRADLYQQVDGGRIARTWAALSAKVDKDGRVFDVSGGTGPSKVEVYASKIRGTYPWGTGAFLMAASSLQQQG